MSAWTQRWDVGRWAPDFVLPSQAGVPTRFYGKAGGVPTLLLFCAGTLSSQQWDNVEIVLHRLREELREKSLDDLACFVLTHQSPDANQALVQARNFACTVFSDTGKEIFDESLAVLPDTQGDERSAGQIQIVVLTPGLWVQATFPLDHPDTAVAMVKEQLSMQPRIRPVEIQAQAPVLLLPQVLEAAACRHLIDVWQQQGHEETGVERSDGSARVETLDDAFKRRQDHIVTDPGLLRMLTSSVGRCVLPQLQKVFSFRATRFEGFKIVCYDASQRGHFRAHRDNLSPATQHRKFALSLNLNEEYEGGQLRFAEYAPHLYRPGTGGAVLFSSSLLHEVLDVTAGQRFALLTFLS